MAQNPGGISLDGLLIERFFDRRLVSDWGAGFVDADAIAARLAYAAEFENDAAGRAFSRCGCPACGLGSDSLTADGAAFPPTDFASQVPTDSIDWGSEVDSNKVTVYFAEDGERFDGVTSRGWSEYDMGQAMAALDTFADVSNLKFTVTDNPDEATFKLVTTTSFFYLGYFNPPGERNEGVGVFAVNGSGWDENGGLDRGGAGWFTMIHEFGHGLGMAHPHDGGGTAEIMSGVRGNPFTGYSRGDFDLNQAVYTTMSYNFGWELHPEGPSSRDTFGNNGGPSALDIAVIQDKYGADMTHATGNDKYILPEVNAAGTFWTCIWDAGGTDQIIHRGSQAAIIDLTAATLDYSPTGGGVISYADGIFGGFTIANGVVIENAKGGDAGDMLFGNDSDNVLKGRDGGDLLFGGGGVDKLLGGAGADQFGFNSLDAGDADTIGDFGAGDTILLDSDVYGLPEGALAAARFVVGAQAGDANDRLIYNDDSGKLFFDADGSGAGDQVLIATLTGTPTLAAGDFIVI